VGASRRANGGARRSWPVTVLTLFHGSRSSGGSGRGFLGFGGADLVRELVGSLIVEARLPELAAPTCDHYDGDVSIAVRHPDTEVVLAAMKTIIAIEYG
jgi:hypothetical protein